MIEAQSNSKGSCNSKMSCYTLLTVLLLNFDYKFGIRQTMGSNIEIQQNKLLLN